MFNVQCSMFNCSGHVPHLGSRLCCAWRHSRTDALPEQSIQIHWPSYRRRHIVFPQQRTSDGQRRSLPQAHLRRCLCRYRPNAFHHCHCSRLVGKSLDCASHGRRLSHNHRHQCQDPYRRTLPSLERTLHRGRSNRMRMGDLHIPAFYQRRG